MLEAIRNNDIDKVKKLLEKQSRVNIWHGDYCLFDAASYEVAKLLIEKGANVNKAHEKLGWTPLMRCVYGAEKRNVDAAKCLIENGANVSAKDKKGWTPLHWACCWSSLEAIKLLIENGADVNAQDEEGRTPLLVMNDFKVDAMLYLFEKGANLNAQDEDGDTILFKIAFKDVNVYNFEAAINFLISHGVNINARNNNGDVLTNQSTVGFVGTCSAKHFKFLLKQGLNINNKNDKGYTILHILIKRHSSEHIKALLDYNVKM